MMEHRPHLTVPGIQAQVSSDLYPEASPDTNADGCRRLASCVCCCSRVHKSTRIKIVWVLLLAVAVTSCIILGCLVFRPDTPHAAPSDMRAVTKHVDFLFCEGVRINSEDINLQYDAYRVSGSLRIDQYRRNENSYPTSLFLESNSYDYYTFFFLENSSFTVYHCAQKRVTFYVFKGADNFNTWSGDKDCEECYLAKRYVQPSSDCGRGDQSFSLTTTSTDDYYLVYDNELPVETWVDIHLFLNRSIYDLTDAESVCLGSTDCLVVLEERQQTPLYQMASYGDIGAYRHARLSTRCVPRVWSYLLFHGAFVILVGVTCSIVIQKFCKNPDDARLRGIGIDERTPLIYATTAPPSYRNAILNPPKYDDAMRYCDPPSYRDVTRNNMADTRQKVSDNSDSVRTVMR